MLIIMTNSKIVREKSAGKRSFLHFPPPPVGPIRLKRAGISGDLKEESLTNCINTGGAGYIGSTPAWSFEQGYGVVGRG